MASALMPLWQVRLYTLGIWLCTIGTITAQPCCVCTALAAMVVAAHSLATAGTEYIASVVCYNHTNSASMACSLGSGGLGCGHNLP